jgi:exosome complex component RRP4
VILLTILANRKDIVVPGEIIAEGDNYKITSGVYKNKDQYFSNVVGVFDVIKNKLQVRPLKGNYYPQVGDIVIGLIEDVMLSSWSVNIGGPYPGVLLVSNAVQGNFDPLKDDTRKIFQHEDAIKAEIISFDRTRDPQLTTKHGSLGKLVGGRIIESNPNFIKRILGRNNSMIGLIKNMTNTKIVVGRNGRIWIRGENIQDELKAIEAIRQVERESHTEGLKERIEELLKSDSSHKENEM